MESSTAATRHSRLSQGPSSHLKLPTNNHQPRITSRLRLRADCSLIVLSDTGLLGFELTKPEFLSPEIAPVKTFSFGAGNSLKDRKLSASEQLTMALKPYVLPTSVLARRPNTTLTYSPLLGLPGKSPPKLRKNSSIADSRDDQVVVDSKFDIRLLRVKNTDESRMLSIDTANFYLQQSSNKSGGIMVTFGHQESLLSPAGSPDHSTSNLQKLPSFNPSEKGESKPFVSKQTETHEVKKNNPSAFSLTRRDKSSDQPSVPRSLLVFKRDRSQSLEKCKGDVDAVTIDLGQKRMSIQELPSKGRAKYVVSSHRITPKTNFDLREDLKSLKHSGLKHH